MAPALQALFDVQALVVCSRLSGLFMQSEGLLALMGPANMVPIGFAGCCALTGPWVVPVPGVTGFAITSLCTHNFVWPISSA